MNPLNEYSSFFQRSDSTKPLAEVECGEENLKAPSPITGLLKVEVIFVQTHAYSLITYIDSLICSGFD